MDRTPKTLSQLADLVERTNAALERSRGLEREVDPAVDSILRPRPSLFPEDSP